MLFIKAGSIFVLFLVTCMLHAQPLVLRLQKNNTTRVVTLKLPKMMVVKYVVNGITYKSKGEVVGYQNMCLVILAGSDTVEILRQNLTSLNFENNTALLLLPVFAMSTVLSLGFVTAAIVDPKESGFFFPFFAGLTLGYCSYKMIRVWHPTLNMASEWSISDR